jgi:dTDP-4-dehydrorhamnose reductase
MIRLASERPEINMVNDQFGCPSNASDTADALLAFTVNPAAQYGTWHFVNSGEASWHDLAAYIFADMQKRGLATPVLNAIPTSQYLTRCAPKQFTAVGGGDTARFWHSTKALARRE